MRKTIQTFSEFVASVEAHCDGGSLHLFRGQDVKVNLLPRIARTDPATNTESTERSMIKELRRMGAALLPEPAADDWELLVVAQHFAMATRLLDWTSNPLAALWFACSSPEAGDRYVYSLAADSLLISSKSQRVGSPFEQAKTRVFQPRLNNPRIVAQDGWFTVHRYSKQSNRFVALEKNPEIRPYLSEFTIPKSARDAILRSLDRHGINVRTLFPDLEGLCRYVSWKLGPA